MCPSRLRLLFIVLTSLLALAACSDGGKVFVYAPASDGVTVRVDGKEFERVRAGQYTTVKLSEGVHHVEVVSSAGSNAAQVQIKSGDRFFLRSPLECYVIFDASSLYGADGSDSDVVESLPIALRVVVDEPVAAPVNLAFGGFPTKVEANARAHVMYNAPCAVVDRDDTALFSAFSSRLEKDVRAAIGRKR